MLMRLRGVFIWAGLLVLASCTNRVVVDLDPVLQFSVDEQVVTRVDNLIEIPVELSRVANEPVIVSFAIEGISVRGGNLTVLAGQTSTRIVIEIPERVRKTLPSEFRVRLVKSTFSKLGNRTVHVIKVR
jgi:protein gp37